MTANQIRGKKLFYEIFGRLWNKCQGRQFSTVLAINDRTELQIDSLETSAPWEQLRKGEQVVRVMSDRCSVFCGDSYMRRPRMKLDNFSARIIAAEKHDLHTAGSEMGLTPSAVHKQIELGEGAFRSEDPHVIHIQHLSGLTSTIVRRVLEGSLHAGNGPPTNFQSKFLARVGEAKLKKVEHLTSKNPGSPSLQEMDAKLQKALRQGNVNELFLHCLHALTHGNPSRTREIQRNGDHHHVPEQSHPHRLPGQRRRSSLQRQPQPDTTLARNQRLLQEGRQVYRAHRMAPLRRLRQAGRVRQHAQKGRACPN